MKNNIGIHIFEQLDDLDFEVELMNFNLISILSWKKYMGPIQIYCNQRYLETLKKWKLDTLYDFIDTDTLENKPKDVNYTEFWAFSKLLVIKNLQKLSQPFTIIDNDLWIHSELTNSNSYDVMMYHKEDYDENFPKNIYTDFREFIPQSVQSLNLDKTILPTNCAILHINNTDFIETWFKLSLDVCRYNSAVKPVNLSTKMCFIEQWLLPMLLNKMGFTYGTFISQTYLSQRIDYQDGSEWSPRIENSSEIQRAEFQNIKHVWGLKRLLSNDYIRNIVLKTTLNDMLEYEIIGKPYDGVFKKLISEFQD